MENAMLTFDNVSAHYSKVGRCAKRSLPYQTGRDRHAIGADGAGKPPCSARCAATPRASSRRIVFDGKDITDWQTAKIMREAVAIARKGGAYFAYDGGRGPGDGRFFCRPQSVQPHRMDLAARVCIDAVFSAPAVRRRAADAGHRPCAPDAAEPRLLLLDVDRLTGAAPLSFSRFSTPSSSCTSKG